jgi:hypothetical protein
MKENMWYLTFWAWLTLLVITSSYFLQYKYFPNYISKLYGRPLNWEGKIFISVFPQQHLNKFVSLLSKYFLVNSRAMLQDKYPRMTKDHEWKMLVL